MHLHEIPSRFGAPFVFCICHRVAPFFRRVTSLGVWHLKRTETILHSPFGVHFTLPDHIGVFTIAKRLLIPVTLTDDSKDYYSGSNTAQ